MKIALVSDSHGRADRLRRAIKMLVPLGAEAIVHCGDVGGAECMRVLGAAGVSAYAVAGNTDRDVAALAEVAAGAGVVFHPAFVEVDLGEGRRLIATHGHDERLVRDVLAADHVTFLCHGHTHLRRDERIGATQVVNPGAIHRGAPRSAALLDTRSGEVTFVTGF